MLDCSSPSFKILSTSNFIVPCIANLLDSIHRFVQNLHKICYFMGLCVFAHRYFLFKTHMMHVIENISSYLYMYHSVLDAQHPLQKHTNSWKYNFAWFPLLNYGMGNLWCVIQSTQLNNSSLHILSFDLVLLLKINFHVRCLNFFLNFNLEKKLHNMVHVVFWNMTPHTLNKFILKWFSINTYYTLTMVTKMEIDNLEFGVCYMVEMLPLGSNNIREKL